ncbi:hypothetical protein VTL71DRAFT_14937 [Oculimacula yallundae]|uniref:Uncharacterized protein n=1 Tax=Oculimacula yallundae TaxID=86028 RepID=A0ABR4CF79_9HELO
MTSGPSIFISSLTLASPDNLRLAFVKDELATFPDSAWGFPADGNGLLREVEYVDWWLASGLRRGVGGGAAGGVGGHVYSFVVDSLGGQSNADMKLFEGSFVG